jgi:L-ascorbate peroxidase
VLTPADIAGCMRLLLADAGTYDAATKTGGADGSIVLT